MSQNTFQYAAGNVIRGLIQTMGMPTGDAAGEHFGQKEYNLALSMSALLEGNRSLKYNQLSSEKGQLVPPRRIPEANEGAPCRQCGPLEDQELVAGQTAIPCL